MIPHQLVLVYICVFMCTYCIQVYVCMWALGFLGQVPQQSPGQSSPKSFLNWHTSRRGVPPCVSAVGGRHTLTRVVGHKERSIHLTINQAPGKRLNKYTSTIQCPWSVSVWLHACLSHACVWQTSAGEPQTEPDILASKSASSLSPFSPWPLVVFSNCPSLFCSSCCALTYHSVDTSILF